MLSLTRRQGEGILIGSDVEVVVLSVSRGRVRIGIRAPRSLPVHRAELVARIEAENLRARATAIQAEAVEDSIIHVPEGLFGLRDHKAFVLCDVGDNPTLKALVSHSDPSLSLYVIEAPAIWTDYPVDKARAAAGLGPDDEVAIAAVVTVPSDGAPPTVNLVAPIVIGLQERHGVQVILEGTDLGVSHALAIRPTGVESVPRGGTGGSAEGDEVQSPHGGPQPSRHP